MRFVRLSFALMFSLFLLCCSAMSTSELACTYAALILHGDAISIAAEKISTLVNAAGLTVESYWPSLFSLSISSSAGNAAPAPVDKQEELMEESEDDMVLGLFD
ncbi:unnamed protein product [Citrullus colocynthis]|uniref:60S acidic ribosomal protein P1 n=1 Tax=Citrullus colocynthis TaxID=252529 RepID=A0ABP0XR98_9ROSI